MILYLREIILDMIKYFISIIAAIILLPLPLSASSVEVGGALRYSWWERQVNEEYRGNFSPGLQYGPLLTINMPKHFSFSSVFYYGNYTRSWWNGSEMFVRYDSESSLLYSATRFLAIFAGFSFSDYNLPVRWPSPVLYARYKTMIYEFAPAIGLSFSVHLFQELYLTIKTSIFYCYNIERNGRSFLIYQASSGGELYPLISSTARKDKLGLNSHLQLYYPISKINTVLAFGCRYQYASVGSRSHGFKAMVYEHYWGITASVSYRLNIPTAVADESEEKENVEPES